MRNNVYSDIFWYGDVLLHVHVWAKNFKFSKFYIYIYTKYMKKWGNNIINSHICILILTVQEMFGENLWKFTISYFPYFASNFHCSFENFHSFYWITCTVRAEIFVVVLFLRISRVTHSRKFPLQFMSIYSNDNISKIAKLATRELPHLAKTAKITVRENNGVYSNLNLDWISPLSLLQFLGRVKKSLSMILIVAKTGGHCPHALSMKGGTYLIW